MSKPFTVGFVLQRLDCNDGVSSHCETLARGIVEKGGRVVFLVGNVSYDEKTRMRYDSLRSSAAGWIETKALSSRPTPSSLRTINNAIRSEKIDVLHTHGLAMAPVCTLAGKRNRIPVVATAHPSRVNMEGAGQRSLIERKVRYGVGKLLGANLAIAISEGVAGEFLKREGYTNDRVRLVHNGIDTNHFRPPSPLERAEARSRFGLCDNDFVCAIVGRLDKGKSHDVLLNAADKCLQNGVDFRILITGSGDKSGTEELVGRNKRILDRIVLTGFVDDPRDVYWAADVLPFPSRYEGFGLVPVEAMACGLVPVRTPSWGAVDQIDNGVDGFIVPMDNADRLAERITELARDPEKRAVMGGLAVAKVSSLFSCNGMVEKTISVYEELLDGKPQHSETKWNPTLTK